MLRQDRQARKTSKQAALRHPLPRPQPQTSPWELEVQAVSLRLRSKFLSTN